MKQKSCIAIIVRVVNPTVRLHSYLIYAVCILVTLAPKYISLSFMTDWFSMGYVYARQLISFGRAEIKD